MPIIPLAKNKGPLLISKVRGGVDDFPPEFVSRFGKDIYVQEVPLDIEPENLTDFILESRLVQERTNERKRINTYFGGAGPNGDGGLTLEDILGVALVSELVLPDGQIGTRTRTLVKEGSHLTANELTVDGIQRNLGNGWLEQIYTTKPTVFPKNSFRRLRPDVVTPLEFRALLEDQETGQILAGHAAMPTLGLGDIEKTDSDLDEFTHQLTTRSRANLTLPKTLTGSRTNQFKQVESITRILELDSTTPAVPTALRDVTFTKLGDGTAIEERVDVPVVFDATRYEVNIPNLIPPEMRAAAVLLTIEQTLAGDASPPVLGSNQFSASDVQVTEYTHRQSVTQLFGISLPVVLTGQEISSEFGGGVLNNARALGLAGTLPVVAGLTILSSVVKPLGNGLELNETRSLAAGTWPTLTSLIWDDEMQSYRREEEQVVAPSYTPVSGANFNESLKAIDLWRSRRIRVTRNPTAVGPGTAIVTYQYAPFKFPGILYRAANGYYVRSASAQLCKQKVKTWWQVSVGPPTISVDEIIMDNVVISSLNDVTQMTYSGEVLHDTITTFGALTYPATTPSYTEYALGTPTGTFTHTDYPSLYSVGGGGYAAGNVLTIAGGGGSLQVTVDAVDGSGHIVSFHVTLRTSNFPLGLSGPYAATGGAGSGAQFYITGVDVPNYTPGTAWIGQEKIVSAGVSPTDIPNLWKVQTKSVVMR